MGHAPRAAAKTRLFLLESPSCPAFRHSPLQPLGTPTNGRWQLYSSLSFPSFNIGSTRQESWAKAAVAVAKNCNSVGSHDGKVTVSMAICFSTSSLLPGMLHLPPLYTACYALNPLNRQVFILFLCSYLTWSTTFSPANKHCLGQEGWKRSPCSNYIVSFLNHFKQSVLRIFWPNTSFLPIPFSFPRLEVMVTQGYWKTRYASSRLSRNFDSSKFLASLVMLRWILHTNVRRINYELLFVIINFTEQFTKRFLGAFNFEFEALNKKIYSEPA